MTEQPTVVVEVSDMQLKAELTSERQRTEELSRLIKQLQRDHDSKCAALNAQLTAEKQRSSSLQVSLQKLAETQLKEMERSLLDSQGREQFLLEEVEKLRKETQQLKTSGCSPEHLQELESTNFLLSERNKALQQQLDDVRNSAVCRTQLSGIKEKEKYIVELLAEKESLEGELDEMQLRIENLEGERCKSHINASVEEIVSRNEELEKENRDLQEGIADLTSLLSHVRESARAEHKHDLDRLQNRIIDLEAIITGHEREVQTLTGKIREMREEKSNLLEELQTLEDTAKTVQYENVVLKQGLKEREKRIDSLQSEAEQNEEMVLESEFLAVKQKLVEAAAKQSEADKRTSAERAELLAEVAQLETLASDQSTKLKQVERESKALKEQNDYLASSLEEWKDKAKDLTEKMQATREQLQKESLDRMIKLKKEKIQLEERINELMEQLDTERRSMSIAGQPSLMDELQLLELQRSSRHSRLSMTTRMSTDKGYEALRLELVPLIQSEKDFLNKSLTSEVEKLREELTMATKRCFNMANSFNQMKEEKDALAKETERLRASLVQETTGRELQSRLSANEEISSLKHEIETWKADHARAQAELIASKEAWITESTLMKQDLAEAEKQAIEAKMLYAEAATDRDIYQKMYKDATKPAKSRLSIFRSKKPCLCTET